MSSIPRNFRIFFGRDTSRAWKAYSQHQVYLTDIGYYQNIQQKLHNSLDYERQMRVELLEKFSHMETSKKSELNKQTKDSEDLQKDIDQLNQQVDGFMNRLQTQLKSMIQQSSDLDEYENQRRSRLALLKDFGNSVDSLQNELEVIHQQKTSVQDPIKDLDFAIKYLDQQIEYSKCEADNQLAYFKELIIKNCLTCSPMQISNWIKQGLFMLVSEITCKLIFEIKDLASQMRSEPFNPSQEQQEISLIKTLKHGLKKHNIKLKKCLQMTGDGYHHRKVRRGDNNKWKKFNINFSDEYTAKLLFNQQLWNSDNGAEALLNKAELSFLNKRKEELAKISKERKVNYNKLIELTDQLSSQIFDFSLEYSPQGEGILSNK